MKARDTMRVAVILLGASTALPAAAADDWDWFLAPYLWATTVEADLEDSRASGSAELDFPGIVDKLNGVLLGHLEGQGDHFGIMADLVYLGLGSGEEFERFDTDTDIETTIFDIAGVWSPGDGRYEGFELLAGVRYLSMDIDVEIDPVNTSLGQGRAGFDTSFTDFLVGGRIFGDFSGRWGGSLRGDISGGDTEGTWLLAGTVTYRTQGDGQWAFGWRHMDIDLEPDDRKLDLTLSGPVIGYAFHF